MSRARNAVLALALAAVFFLPVVSVLAQSAGAAEATREYGWEADGPLLVFEQPFEPWIAGPRWKLGIVALILATMTATGLMRWDGMRWMGG